MKRLVAIIMLWLAAAPALAALTPAAFDPKIGAQIDLSTRLTDANGATRPLSAVMAGKPAVVLWGYNLCPNLCGVAQEAIADALAKTGLTPANYTALFITVDPDETPQDAAAAYTRLVAATGAAAEEPWHFLTGPAVSGLSAQFGIGSEERKRIAQFVHPVGAIALTPNGRISRVLSGIEFAPRDLRLALVEASQGKLGTFFEHILLLCAGFDTSRGRYNSVIFVGLQIAAVATLAGLGLALYLLRRGRAGQ
jgi:protein SCO1/2